MACPNPDKFFPLKKSPALVKGALKDKIALVTGGGTGIGRVIATTFAALGAQVAIAARRLDVLEATAAEIRQSTGGDVAAFKMDVKDATQVAKAIDEIEKRFGNTPNILVNNAAGNFIMATERLSDNAISTVIDIGLSVRSIISVLKGTIRVTTEIGRRSIKNGRGCAVLSITTPYSRAGSPFVVPSAVSKAGVEILTKSLATEWAKYGFRFNVIAPGPVPTKGAFGRLSGMSYEQTVELAALTVPVGRVGAPEEIANMAAFLCSDYATFINGAIVDVDGGQQHLNHGSSIGGSALHELTPEDWEDMERTIRGRTGKTKNDSKL